MTNWISVEQELPPYGRYVLVTHRWYKEYDNRTGVTIGYRSHTNATGEHYATPEGTELNVTHWMPKPEPAE